MAKSVGLQSEEIVDNILRDMTSRGGLDHAWDSIDEETQSEIRDTWMLIARRVIEAAPTS